MPRTKQAFVIPADVFAPRTEEQRWRIYLRHGDELDLIATTDSPAGVGTAIFTLDQDERERGRRLYDRGVIGVLDGIEGSWLVLPWTRQEKRATIGREIPIRESS